ncbi:MAG: hypothetical protein ABII80_00265 [bacterium]
MNNWLKEQRFLIGFIALGTAGYLYYLSFNGLKIGINISIAQMAIGYAIAFQLFELIGLILKFTGKLVPNDKNEKYIFKTIEYTLYVVLIVDFLMVFLGYQGFNDLGPGVIFNKVVIVLGRLLISLLAAVFPELLTIFAIHLWGEAWAKLQEPIVTDVSKTSFRQETNLVNSKHPLTGLPIRQVG